MNPQLERYIMILVKLGITLLGLVTTFFAIQYVLPMIFSVSGFLAWGFLPFILALVIAILIDPLVDWLVGKKRVNRTTAVAFSLLLVLTVVSVAIIFMVSRLVIELAALYGNLPAYTQYFMNYGVETAEQIRIFLTNNPLPVEAQNVLKNNLQTGLDSLTALVAASTNYLFNLLTGLPGFVTIIIVSAIATFFVSRDKPLITGSIYRFTPKKYVKPLSNIISDISKALIGFFRAQIILISITTLQTIIGLYILGARYALTMGLIVGFVDIVPILGPGAVLVPWAVISILTGSYNFGIGLLILYAIVIGIRQLIEPKIIASSIGIHPLATLIALYLGLKFLGISGIIIGPFLLVLGKAVMKSIYHEK